MRFDDDYEKRNDEDYDDYNLEFNPLQNRNRQKTLLLNTYFFPRINLYYYNSILYSDLINY